MPKELPLPLTHAEATELAEKIEEAIARVRMDFIRARRPDLDDPRGENPHGTKVIYREISLALGRCCVRYGFDLLAPAAASHIDRLEVALAEANAQQERFREAHIVPPAKFPEHSNQGNGRVIEERCPKHGTLDCNCETGRQHRLTINGHHHDGCSCERCRAD